MQSRHVDQSVIFTNIQLHFDSFGNNNKTWLPHSQTERIAAPLVTVACLSCQLGGIVHILSMISRGSKCKTQVLAFKISSHLSDQVL